MHDGVGLPPLWLRDFSGVWIISDSRYRHENQFFSLSMIDATSPGYFVCRDNQEFRKHIRCSFLVTDAVLVVPQLSHFTNNLG